MKRLFLIPLMIVLVSGLILGGCTKPAPVPVPAPAPELPPIKVGLLYPLTGPMAMTGELMVTASKFGFEEVGYEVAGRKIEIIVEDTAATPSVAIDKAKKLIEFDKVNRSTHCCAEAGSSTLYIKDGGTSHRYVPKPIEAD